MDTATTSKVDFTGISVLGYEERTSVATTPPARVQTVLLVMKVLEFWIVL